MLPIHLAGWEGWPPPPYPLGVAPLTVPPPPPELKIPGYPPLHTDNSQHGEYNQGR